MAKKTSIIGAGLSELEQAFREAQAIKKAAKVPALPLNLKRSAPKTKQQLQLEAERVARQMMGEHVTSGKKGDTKNLAGRSMKEAKRVQALDYKLSPTQDLPEVENYTPSIGEVKLAVPGDQTISDRIIDELEGLAIGSEQQGGSLYGLGKMKRKKPLFWASNEGPAGQLQGKVDKLSQLYNTDLILGEHLAMGSTSNNFAMHMADANLKAFNSANVHPAAVDRFNEIIREGYQIKNPKTGEYKVIKFPKFPGIDRPNEAYLAMMKDPEMRKFFNARAKTPAVTEPLGLPNGLDVEYAATEPTLRNMEINLTGNSVGRLKPGEALTDDPDHDTYLKGIVGDFLGKREVLTPFKIGYPDAADYVMATQRPQDFTGTIQKVFPHQTVDQQYLDEYNTYRDFIKKYTGKAKGGKVGKVGKALSELEKAYEEAKAAKASYLKDSKVKDVMYHGSNYNTPEGNTLTEFNKGKGMGIHVGTQEQADNINKIDRGWKSEQYKGNAHVLPVHINARNPLRVTDTEANDPITLLNALLNKNLITGEQREMLRKQGNKNPNINAWKDTARTILQDLGFDSLVYENMAEGAGDSYVLLNPNQLKSAIGNKGTFDPNEADIRKAKGGKIGKAAGFLNELEKAYEEAKAIKSVESMPSVNRIDMNYKDVTKRVPELTKAANQLDSGEITSDDYDKLVNLHKPVEPYSFVPSPASYDDAMRALTKNKQPMYGKGSEIQAGEQTDLRLDIPAYKDHGVWVNSIHRKDAPTVYDSVSSVKNATMMGSPDKALKVAKGGPKAPFAVIRGEWNPIGQEDAVKKAQEGIASGEWVQVGYDPERHGYFYDRKTMQPIEKAEEIIQIGPLVIAKHPSYANKAKQKYADGGRAKLEQEFINADTVHMAEGGYRPVVGSPYGKGSGRPVTPQATLPDLDTLALTGKILARKGKEQLQKELANPSRQMAADILGNLAADIIGMPSDMIEGARGEPINTKGRNKPYNTSTMQQSKGKRMLGSENIRDQLKNAGITSGEERPLTEMGLGLISPAAIAKGPKFLKAMENLPVGLSIKDVSEGAEEAKRVANFVSSVEKTIKGHKMDSMPGEQWANWMRANASKSAKKEAEATGLYEWLKTQPKATKADIEAYVEGNLPKIKTKVIGAKAYTDEDVLAGKLPFYVERKFLGENKWGDPEYQYLDENNEVAYRSSNPNAVLRYASDAEPNQLKYADYTLPGGQNYKEMLLSLPRNELSTTPRMQKVYEITDANGQLLSSGQLPMSPRMLEKINNNPDWQVREFEQANPNDVRRDTANFQSSHYEEPNILAHLRTNERLTPDQKRVLFLEELQSDWAQKARGEGFLSPDLHVERRAEIKAEMDTLAKEATALRERGESTVDIRHRMRQLDDALRDIPTPKGVPTAPYLADTKDWTALGLKHALKKAVDEGQDYLAWTTGAQQADRYNLAQHIDDIHYVNNGDGTYTIMPRPKGERTAIDEINGVDLRKVSEKDLPNVVGKEVANKIINEEGTLGGFNSDFNRTMRLDNVDLQIGGEGMKGYYDQIVPQTMNDILKQYGVKDGVKEVGIELHPSQIASDYESLELTGRSPGDVIKPGNYSQQMGIEITPELRERILSEGLPHFKRGGQPKRIDLETQFRLADILTR